MVAAGAFLAVYAIVSLIVFPLFSSQDKYLRSQSWVGVKKQWLAKLRAGLDSIMNVHAMVAEGYEKVGRHQQS